MSRVVIISDLVPITLTNGCTANGSGNINDMLTLAADGTATYTLVGAISESFIGTLSNTATVAAPAGVVDPVLDNNSATDTTSGAT